MKEAVAAKRAVREDKSTAHNEVHQNVSHKVIAADMIESEGE